MTRVLGLTRVFRSFHTLKSFADERHSAYQFRHNIYQDNRNYVIHHKSGAHIPLSASSSGQQSVVPLYSVVEHFTKKLNTTTIVEEPELNLYPIAQKDLVSYLVSKGTQGENQILGS